MYGSLVFSGAKVRDFTFKARSLLKERIASICNIQSTKVFIEGIKLLSREGDKQGIVVDLEAS